MKAYLFDPKDKSLKDVDVSSWTEISPLIGCRTFACHALLPNGDTMYCDDEGLLDQFTHITYFERNFYPEGIAGRLLFLGSDEAGESRDVQSQKQEILARFKGVQVYERNQAGDVVEIRSESI